MQKWKCTFYSKRDKDKLDGYVGSEARPFGRHYTTDYTSRIYPFIANEGGYIAEVQLIRDNKKSLIDQTIAYISSTYPSLNYSETKCRRDAGLIIDGLVFDLEYGEYNGTLNAGLAYYGQAAYLPTDQVTPTADSIDQLATYINNILTTPAVETIVTNYVGGVAEIIRGNNFNQPKNNEELDVFLMNDATIIRNITVQQHGGFMEVLDPVGQIKTRSPYTQTASSFSRSKAPDVSFAGGMYVDGFCGNLDARLVQANSTTEIVIGFVGAATTKSIILGSLILATGLFFVEIYIMHPFAMILMLVLTSLTFSLLGFLIGMLSTNWEELSIFPTLILSPLVFLGGSLYSINWLPEFWQNVSLVNPVLYLVSGFRWSFYEMADVSITTSLIMIFTFLILNITAIIYIFSKGFKIKD